MGKTSKSLFIGALASSLFAGGAVAADFTPPPVIDFEPEYEEVIGGNLYLRGFVGFASREVSSLSNVLFHSAAEVQFLNSQYEGGGLAGVGVGYRFNDFFRLDVTGEYRFRAGYDGFDRVATTTPGVFTQTNQYTADQSEWVVLANAYVDLGTYANVTPYVGAGVGAVHTTISGFTDTNVPALGVAYADDRSDWDFAWALYAGLGYQVNERFSVDLGYRYMNLGSAATGDITTYTGVNNVNNPMHFNDIESHDIIVGMRWDLGSIGGGMHAPAHGVGYGGY